MARRQARQRDFLTTLSEGRSGRAQFWGFYAFILVPAVGLYLIYLIDGSQSWKPAIIATCLIWILMFLVPMTAAMARRFHDINWSGYWSFVQFGAIVLVFFFAITFPILARPTIDVSCYRIGTGLGALLGGNVPEDFAPPPLSPEKQVECDAQEKQRDAFDARLETLEIASLILIATTHVATLLPLVKPSQPGPNKYGPNPHEVTP